MTPTSVGLVLVEGQDADGATMDGNAFDVRDGAIKTSEQATAAVLRTEALAATRGLRLHSIGVTWSEESDAEASLLMRSLSESGFDNVVAIRMPEATEALARGMASVIGYETTAVCVIEPETVITLIVHTRDGAVQTAFNHAIDSDESLISWLSTVFTRADWQPEALVVVGSAGGFESIRPRLEDALSVPVFAPEEAQLALARGAALASAQSMDGPLDLDEGFDAFRPTSEFADGQSRYRAPVPRRRVPVGAATMLVAGVVTFVVSVSLAISLQLSPHDEARSASPVPAAADAPPAAVRPVLPRPAAVPAPPPAAPPLIEAPPADVVAPDAALAPEAPIIDQVPAAEPEYPPVEIPDPYLAPPPAAVAPPAAVPAPPVVAPPASIPYPTKKPGILGRIRDKLRFGDDEAPAQVAPPVPLPPG